VRDVVDFYRRRPFVGVIVALLGLGLAVSTAALGTAQRPVAAVVLAVVLGLLVGGAMAAAQRSRDR